MLSIKYRILLIIIIIAILFLYNKQENITFNSEKTLSVEDLQIIASFYNNQNLNTSANTQTNSLDVSGSLMTKNINSNEYALRIILILKIYYLHSKILLLKLYIYILKNPELINLLNLFI